MKKRVLVFVFLLLALAAGLAAAQTRTVTDMAGRKVVVPARINKIYCMNPACAMMIYTIAPERMASWSLQLTEKQRSYLAAPYNKLYGPGPVAGGQSPMAGGGAQTNVEQLMKMHPDVIMALTDPTDRSSIEMLDKMAEQTHLPTYLIDMRLKSVPAVYENLGALLGVEKRAAALAKYSRDTLTEVESKVKDIPMEKRPRVYYASGPDGLTTLFDGAPHAEPIPYGGGLNVAQVTGGGRPHGAPHGAGNEPPQSHIAMGQSRGQVSIEQVLTWNPSVIIVAAESNALGDRFYKQTIWNDPLWKSVTAVKNHAVYSIPAYPFGWVMPPASINRILGVKWMAVLLHPELFHYNMRQEAKRFYALFYNKNLGEAELNELLPR